MNDALVLLLVAFASYQSFKSFKHENLILELMEDLEECHSVKSFNTRIQHVALSSIKQDLNTYCLTKCGAIVNTDIIVSETTQVYLANTQEDVTKQIESVFLNPMVIK